MKYRGLIITLMILSGVLLGNAFSTIEGMFYPDDLVFRMPNNVEKAEGLSVIDGKTIKVRYTGLVETEKTVELIGVDISQFESNAKLLLEKLVEGKTIYLSYDWEGEADGKVKAYVWRYFPNIVGGYHLMVNAILLANGYAVIDTEEYITTKMAAILYETSDTAMKNKYGELKKFASEKPLKYSELEKEMQIFLYDYYWEPEPVATGTIGEPITSTTNESNESVEFNLDFFFEYAQCHDGATSTASGSGACSSHDGVSYEVYKRNTGSDNYSSLEDSMKTAYLLAKYLIDHEYFYTKSSVNIPEYNSSYVTDNDPKFFVELLYSVIDEGEEKEYSYYGQYEYIGENLWKITFDVIM